MTDIQRARLQARFLTAFKELQADKTSARTERAVFLGQSLLQDLPTDARLYPVCSSCLAQCLFVMWEKTGAEKRRDRELLDIIGSRVDPAVTHCLSNDPNRSLIMNTQKTYYCILRNFSARLEDDFWNHEHINTLNASIVYAKSAWQVLRDNKAEARHTADNLGNLYMSRYLYLGRSGDLDDALTFSTTAVLASGEMASEFRFQSYVQQAVRLAYSSLFLDQPNAIDDAIDYMSHVVEGRSWDVENRGVTADSGSSYAVALRFFSRIHYCAFIRRNGQTPHVVRCLAQAASLVEIANRGIMQVDPGRQLCLIDSAFAHLNQYLMTYSLDLLEKAIKSAISALDLSDCLFNIESMHTRHSGIRMTGQGGSISSLVTTDSRSTTQRHSSLNERRNQRDVVEALSITADVLIARYQRWQSPEDLENAMIALKLSIQGIHGWSPKRPRMLFKLNQTLREHIRKLGTRSNERLYNFYRRSSTNSSMDVHLRKAHHQLGSGQPNGSGAFAPLVRLQDTASILGFEPILGSSWDCSAPRGAYERDMQLSTDAPSFLTSATTMSAEQSSLQQRRADPRIDHLFEKLPPDDEETLTIRMMWRRIYCVGGPSVKRAEMYQRALAVFIRKGDLETACELSDLAESSLGHLELYLLEPKHYIPDLSHASNLATTIACLWLTQGRDPYAVIWVLEKGRELGSQHNMNKVRSYGFQAREELLPQVHSIRGQLERSAEPSCPSGRYTEGQFEGDSKDLVKLLKELARSEAELRPFGRQHSIRQAGNGFIVHLITAPKVGTYAIITSSHGFQKLELPLSTYEQLVTRVNSLRGAIKLCEDQQSLKGPANKKLRSMLSWLWKTVAKPIIQFLHLSRHSSHDSWNLPHIKWIACGVFSQLPIHAAGNYTQNPTEYLDQYVVSSYLSSVRGSVSSQQRKPWIPHYQNANREFTIFGMSTSPSVPEGALSDLAVEEEKRRIFASLGSSFIKNTIDNCNIGMAKNMMHWARIIHFTCHDIPHPTDPSKSRLVLLRDDKEPCTVAAIRDMDIPNALLLFLSACHSAIDPRTAETDEITHLAKAFLLAGFPNVIGTLWQAYQASALEIAAVFYEHVAERWKPDMEEPEQDMFPRALHAAVCRWRDDGNLWKAVDWASWVCFTG